MPPDIPCFSDEYLYAFIGQAAAEFVCLGTAAGCLLSRDGNAGASGGIILAVQVCPGCFCKDEFRFRRFGAGECRPVFSHPWFGGAAQWVL